MKCLLLIFLFAWCENFTAWCWPSSAKAQSNPPFQNPSLDSNCYFPQIGVPGEIDTIYGDSSGEGLGAYIHNLGPKPDGTPGNMLIGNGSTSPFVDWEETQTGPNFNLHNLKATAQRLKIDPTHIHFGHFHDQTHLDLFDGDNSYIYWANVNGNYDSSRRTELHYNIHGDVLWHTSGFDLDFGPYIAHLTSDTIDDIVAEFHVLDSNSYKDSEYYALYRGGSNLYGKSIAYEDTSLVIDLGGTPDTGQWQRVTLQGDFRGTGRQDLLGAGANDALFFFANDPPFTLQKLLYAMHHDTMWTLTDNPKMQLTSIRGSWNSLGTSLSMKALPKSKGDNSVDYLATVPIKNDPNSEIFFFRGGPEFGSHRLTLDSAAYVIKTPATLGQTYWPGSLINAGDMTGTGNLVISLEGADDTYAYQDFYVTGQALDDKIDIYDFFPAGMLGDTLTANADNLEDFLMGLPVYTDKSDFSNGLRDIGSSWLMYGSKNIPVHLNPQFADVKDIQQTDGAGIIFAPNPIIRSWSVATIVWPEAEPEAQYSIYDMLGREMERGTIRLLGGPEQQRIYFSNLPQGTYIYVITGSKHTASAKVVKLSAASTGSGSQPNIIQQMKAARDAPR